eukprot:122477-Pelagomonas_calceolata.AAC.6
MLPSKQWKRIGCPTFVRVARLQSAGNQLLSTRSFACLSVAGSFVHPTFAFQRASFIDARLGICAEPAASCPPLWPCSMRPASFPPASVFYRQIFPQTLPAPSIYQVRQWVERSWVQKRKAGSVGAASCPWLCAQKKASTVLKRSLARQLSTCALVQFHALKQQGMLYDVQIAAKGPVNIPVWAKEMQQPKSSTSGVSGPYLAPLL